MGFSNSKGLITMSKKSGTAVKRGGVGTKRKNEASIGKQLFLVSLQLSERSFFSGTRQREGGKKGGPRENTISRKRAKGARQALAEGQGGREGKGKTGRNLKDLQYFLNEGVDRPSGKAWLNPGGNLVWLQKDERRKKKRDLNTKVSIV